MLRISLNLKLPMVFSPRQLNSLTMFEMQELLSARNHAVYEGQMMAWIETALQQAVHAGSGSE